MRALEKRTPFGRTPQYTERSWRLHRERLRQVKKSVDDNPPSTLAYRQKSNTSPTRKHLLQKEVVDNVYRENIFLARKIFEIMEGEGELREQSHPTEHMLNHPGTMNYRVRVDEARRIHSRNMVLAARLHQMRPYLREDDFTVSRPAQTARSISRRTKRYQQAKCPILSPGPLPDSHYYKTRSKFVNELATTADRITATSSTSPAGAKRDDSSSRSDRPAHRQVHPALRSSSAHPPSKKHPMPPQSSPKDIDGYHLVTENPSGFSHNSDDFVERVQFSGPQSAPIYSPEIQFVTDDWRSHVICECDRPCHEEVKGTSSAPNLLMHILVIKEPFCDCFILRGETVSSTVADTSFCEQLSVSSNQQSAASVEQTFEAPPSGRYELKLSSEEVSTILDGDYLVTSFDNPEMWTILVSKVELSPVEDYSPFVYQIPPTATAGGSKRPTRHSQRENSTMNEDDKPLIHFPTPPDAHLRPSSGRPASSRPMSKNQMPLDKPNQGLGDEDASSITSSAQKIAVTTWNDDDSYQDEFYEPTELDATTQAILLNPVSSTQTTSSPRPLPPQNSSQNGPRPNPYRRGSGEAVRSSGIADPSNKSAPRAEKPTGKPNNKPFRPVATVIKPPVKLGDQRRLSVTAKMLPNVIVTSRGSTPVDSTDSAAEIPDPSPRGAGVDRRSTLKAPIPTVARGVAGVTKAPAKLITEEQFEELLSRVVSPSVTAALEALSACTPNDQVVHSVSVPDEEVIQDRCS